MKIGITGTDGFLGRSVSKFLDEIGHLIVPLDSITRSEFSTDKIEKLKIHSLDWVLHFGSKTSISESQIDPFSTYATNINSTLSALKIAEMSNAGILFMSSFVYGNPKYSPIDEKHPVQALNPYMGSKIISEEICSQISHLKNIPLVILRGFHIYGEDIIPGRLISDLFIAIKKEEELFINDPKPKRDYLYVKDFNNLILKIVKKNPIQAGVYNVGFGEVHSNLEVANLFKNLIKYKREVKIIGKKRENDVLACAVDAQLIKKTFSWSPKYSLKEGMIDILRFHKLLK